MPVNAKELLTKLKNDPVKFLKQNVLGIAGQGPGFKDCFLQERVGGAPGELSISNVQLQNLGPNESVKFSAYSVEMQTFASVDVTQIKPFILGSSGPDIMVTGQLSGCSFCMMPHKNGQELVCAHIQPQIPGNHAKALQESLAKDGRFAGLPDGEIVVYGKKDYKDFRTTILGVRKNGRWAIYTQQRDNNNVIKVAAQIFPE